jgi:hypothetical protein
MKIHLIIAFIHSENFIYLGHLASIKIKIQVIAFEHNLYMKFIQSTMLDLSIKIICHPWT